MKTLRTRIVFLLLLTISNQLAFAASDSLKIVKKTNIGLVEYWFTESAETNAKNDGSPLIEAIGPGHFRLIESLASVGRQTDGFKAYVISRVNFRSDPSFELMGVVINGKLHVLAKDKNEDVVKNFVAALLKNSVRIDGNLVSAK